MKFILLLIPLLLFSEVIFGQDQVSKPSGTQVIPMSSKSSNVRWETGMYLDSIILDPCNETERPNYQENGKLEKFEITDSSMQISIKIMATCCLEFLCEVDMQDSSTINLIYHPYGIPCACGCCFGLTYVFKNLSHKEDNQHEKLINLQYYIINGDLSKRQKLSL